VRSGKVGGQLALTIENVKRDSVRFRAVVASSNLIDLS
jgi:hypothetical protein